MSDTTGASLSRMKGKNCRADPVIENRRQLENTRAKLKLLEDALLDLDKRPATNAYTHRLTRLSLKKLVNQLTEEIIRFEAHLSAQQK